MSALPPPPSPLRTSLWRGMGWAGSQQSSDDLLKLNARNLYQRDGSTTPTPAGKLADLVVLRGLGQGVDCPLGMEAYTRKSVQHVCGFCTHTIRVLCVYFVSCYGPQPVRPPVRPVRRGAWAWWPLGR